MIFWFSIYMFLWKYILVFRFEQLFLEELKMTPSLDTLITHDLSKRFFILDHVLNAEINGYKLSINSSNSETKNVVVVFVTFLYYFGNEQFVGFLCTGYRTGWGADVFCSYCFSCIFYYLFFLLKIWKKHDKTLRVVTEHGQATHISLQ